MTKKCGAKTRSNGVCKSKPMANGRCRMHGGSSKGPKKPNTKDNAVTHGFYADALQAEERIVWERVKIGSIEDEIRLMRVKLHRLVRLSGSADVADLIDSALEVAQKRDAHPTLGVFDKSEIRVKAPQYADLILVAVGEIRKLELQRLQMQLLDQRIKEGGGEGDDSNVVGFDVIPYADE